MRCSNSHPTGMCQILKPVLALLYRPLKQGWELWCSIVVIHQIYYTKVVDLQSSCISMHKTLGLLSWSEKEPHRFSPFSMVNRISESLPFFYSIKLLIFFPWSKTKGKEWGLIIWKEELRSLMTLSRREITCYGCRRIWEISFISLLWKGREKGIQGCIHFNLSVWTQATVKMSIVIALVCWNPDTAFV